MERFNDPDLQKRIFNPNNSYLLKGQNPFRTIKEIHTPVEVKTEVKHILNGQASSKDTTEPNAECTVATQTEGKIEGDSTMLLMEKMITGDITDVSYHVVSEFYIGDTQEVIVCCAVGEAKEYGTGNKKSTAVKSAAQTMLNRLNNCETEKQTTISNATTVQETNNDEPQTSTTSGSITSGSSISSYYSDSSRSPSFSSSDSEVLDITLSDFTDSCKSEIISDTTTESNAKDALPRKRLDLGRRGVTISTYNPVQVENIGSRTSHDYQTGQNFTHFPNRNIQNFRQKYGL